MDASRILGSSVQRREDPELLTGSRNYTDDFADPEVVHAAILRSRHAHARIESIDVTAAAAMDEVLGVYTAEDYDAGSGVIRTTGHPPGSRTTERPIINGDRVRYTGEALAVVVAEHRYVAHDALDAIEVDYERLDAVSDSRAAVEDDSPAVHDDWPNNVAFDWEFGDRSSWDDVSEAADHLVELDLHNQRLVSNPMEPRSVLVSYDEGADELDVKMSTQQPHGCRSFLSSALDFPAHSIRVEAPAVGGGFGTKGQSYPADAITAWCSIKLGRPVKWTQRRSEGFRTDYQGRDIHASCQLALDSDGRILGLHVNGYVGMGAYVGWAPTPASNFRHLLSSQYRIPTITGRLIGTFTNTTPIAPYRGAGRPESIFTIERLMKTAADELGIDPADLRRRNQIQPDEFPYRTATDAEYDSGDYEAALDNALETVGYHELRDRQAELRATDRYLGIGLSCFVENTGSSPRSNPEYAMVRIHRSGRVTAYCGTSSHGQGHETSFAQLLAAELGVPHDDIEIREGDTDELTMGNGTFGSRSAPVGASSLAVCAEKVIENGRELAARHFEASVDDINFDAGEFFIEGAADRSISVQGLAQLVHESDEFPDDQEYRLEASGMYDPKDYAYSFGTHIAVVEIDPSSGAIDLQRFVAVDDCGTQINPMIVEGQIHGGVAQGIGQALYEGAIYDDSGTLVSGSFQDYALPRAMHVPDMETEETVTPCPHNPIGVKGVGESGTIGAPPAIVNAVIDALEPFEVRDLEMPITDETVWRAIHGSG